MEANSKFTCFITCVCVKREETGILTAVKIPTTDYFSVKLYTVYHSKEDKCFEISDGGSLMVVSGVGCTEQTEPSGSVPLVSAQLSHF